MWLAIAMRKTWWGVVKGRGQSFGCLMRCIYTRPQTLLRNGQQPGQPGQPQARSTFHAGLGCMHTLCGHTPSVSQPPVAPWRFNVSRIDDGSRQVAYEPSIEHIPPSPSRALAFCYFSHLVTCLTVKQARGFATPMPLDSGMTWETKIFKH